MKYILLVPMFLVLSCNRQQRNLQNRASNSLSVNDQVKGIIEKFNIRAYNGRKVSNSTTFFKDEVEFQQFDVGSGDDLVYVEYEIPPEPEYFLTYREYFYSGVLKTKGLKFKGGNFQKGTWRKYNIEGELVEEINYDLPYKFTFEDLSKLIKEKGTIDLYEKNTKISRGMLNGRLLWQIKYKKVPMRRETIQIDGITGEIVERSFYPHEDN